MFTFERAADRRTAFEPSCAGRWWFEGRPEVHLVLVCGCPGCGKDSSMSKDIHSIANDGTVSPSYVCPHAPCTFHEFVQLGGWTPPDRRTR